MGSLFLSSDPRKTLFLIIYNCFEKLASVLVNWQCRVMGYLGRRKTRISLSKNMTITGCAGMSLCSIHKIVVAVMFFKLGFIYFTSPSEICARCNRQNKLRQTSWTAVAFSLREIGLFDCTDCFWENQIVPSFWSPAKSPDGIMFRAREKHKCKWWETTPKFAWLK